MKMRSQFAASLAIVAAVGLTTSTYAQQYSNSASGYTVPRAQAGGPTTSTSYKVYYQSQQNQHRHPAVGPRYEVPNFQSKPQQVQQTSFDGSAPQAIRFSDHHEAPANAPVAEEKAADAPVVSDSYAVPSFHCDSCGTRYFTRVEALWLDRSNTDIFLGNAAGGVPALRADNIEFNRELGMKLLIGRQMNDDTSVELSYFGLNEWNENSAGIATAAGAFSPYLTAASLAAANTAMVANYESDVHNVELNLRRQMGNGIALLGGLRYIRVEEDFSLSLLNGANVAERTTTHSENDLFGLQTGGEIVRRRGAFGLEAYSKFALLLNASDQQVTNVTNPNAAPVINLATGDDELDGTAMIDLGLMLTLRLRQNMVIRGGYQLMYLSGLALAPEQLIRTNNDINNGTINAATGRGVNNNGNVLYHGPSFGFEYMWGGGR